MKNERRKYPRVVLTGEASIALSGIVRTGKLMNVSPSGIQIESRRQLIEQLCRFKDDAGLYPEFDLEFVLPNGMPVKARCGVSHCRRISQEIYHLGLNFTALSQLDEQRVDEYINHAVAA